MLLTYDLLTVHIFYICPQNCRYLNTHRRETCLIRKNISLEMWLFPLIISILLLQFMDDEEFVDTIKGFSTVRKEHTMFTDTNLWPSGRDSNILNKTLKMLKSTLFHVQLKRHSSWLKVLSRWATAAVKREKKVRGAQWDSWQEQWNNSVKEGEGKCSDIQTLRWKQLLVWKEN